MAPKQEIVITGIGVVSPIGIEKETFWSSLREGRSGVRRLETFDDRDLPVPIGASVDDFEPKRYVRPRKSLKVMSRDIQLAFAAADLACEDAGLHEHPVNPERLGVVFGAEMIPCELSELAPAFRGCMVNGEFDFDRWGETAMEEMYPLWMLKYLPNMPACHIGIAQDARGPNNSLTLAEASGLSALAEAARVIERGHADVMISGGASSRINEALWVRNRVFELSRRRDDPAAACRPFDAERDGMINGEGAGAFILESGQHAQTRGANVLARILGYACTFEPVRNGKPLEGRAIRKAIVGAVPDAGLAPEEVGHINAHGVSTRLDDKIEAAAIHDTLGEVPVTAPKSNFGNLGAAAGAVETAVSVLALEHGLIPPTLNYQQPDPECPVRVVHGEPLNSDRPTALILNHTRFGQAVGVVLGAPD